MAENRSFLQRVLGLGGDTTLKAGGTAIVPDYDIGPYARGVGTVQMTRRSVLQLRKWSRSNPWIRAAINLRRQQVSRAKWDIVTYDGEERGTVRKINQVKELLRYPNRRMDSWRSLIEPVVEDILVLDQGCIEVIPTRGGAIGLEGAKPVAELIAKNGGSIAFNNEWDGEDDNDPRYYEVDETGRQVRKFKNHELMVIIANPVTYSPIGLSPLEVLADTIEADLTAAAYNAKAVSAAAPPGVLHLGEGIRADQVDSFKAYWDTEISGRSQIAITGGGKGVQWIPLASSNRDMQFMEWQVYLARKICAVFGVQPQDIGIGFDVNRASAEVGAAFTQDNGIAPLLDLIAEYMTREIIWRYDKNLRFVYTEVGRESQGAMSDYYKSALSGMPWLKLNEALQERGHEGIGEMGDDIFIPSPKGYIPLSRYEEYLNVALSSPVVPDNNPDGTDGASPAQGGPDNPGEQTNGGETMNPQQQTSKSLPGLMVGFQALYDEDWEARPAVVDAIAEAKSSGRRVAIVIDVKCDRDEVADWLSMDEISYDDLIINPWPKGSENRFALYSASRLLREGELEVLENTDTRAEDYKSIGVKFVLLRTTEELTKGDGPSTIAPAGVKAEARKGLKWREEYGRGGIGPGQATARMIIGDRLSIARVRKMNAYFARHEVDKKGKGWAPGSEGYPSNGRIAWSLWGGDAGKSWSAKVSRQSKAKK